MSKLPPPFLNGLPELIVLKLLSQQERYGYELVKAIQLQTQERLKFGEGCVYPYLHHLERQKMVTSRRREVGGRERYYYQITAKGRRRLEALAEEWSRVAEGVALILEERHA